jgi:adenine-specific DNA glycosylase
MVKRQINQDEKNAPGKKSKQQKQEVSHFHAYYYENRKEKFSNLETREQDIFRGFFWLVINFFTGTKTREPQRFWERVNFSKEKVIKQLFSVLGNFSHFFPLLRKINSGTARGNTTSMLGLLEINSVAN